MRRLRVTIASAISVGVALSYAPRAAADMVPGAITSYFDTNTTTEYVYYVDFGGNVDVLSCGLGGCWKSAVAVPWGYFIPGSSLISYFDSSFGHLFFQSLDSNGNNILYHCKGTNGPASCVATEPEVLPSTPGATRTIWNLPNGAVEGIKPLANLTGYWDGHDDHVFYLDGSSNVHEAYFNGQWWDHVIAAASALPAPPSLFVRSSFDGTEENVFFSLLSPAGPQWDWTGFPNGNWSPEPVPALNGFDNISVMSIAGITHALGPWDVGSSYALAYNTNESGGFADNPTVPVPYFDGESSLTTWAIPHTELAYVGVNQHVYWLDVNSSPVDLTTSTGNDGALAGANTPPDGQTRLSPISGFYDSAAINNEHVFYVDTSGNVEEFYWHPYEGNYTEHVIGGSGNAVTAGFPNYVDH